MVTTQLLAVGEQWLYDSMEGLFAEHSMAVELRTRFAGITDRLDENPPELFLMDPILAMIEAGINPAQSIADIAIYGAPKKRYSFGVIYREMRKRGIPVVVFTAGFEGGEDRLELMYGIKQGRDYDHFIPMPIPEDRFFDRLHRILLVKAQG